MSEVAGKGRPAQTGWTQQGVQQMKELLPFLQAARIGLARSRWRPGDNTDDLLAPIVLAILVEVARTLRIGELVAQLDGTA